MSGVDIYDVKTREPVKDLPHKVSAMYGPVCAIKWVQRQTQAEDFLLIGTADGFVFIWTTCHDVSVSSCSKICKPTDRH